MAGHLLIGQRARAGDGAAGIVDVRADEHRDDTRQARSLARVDALDPGMRMTSQQEATLEHAG